MASPVQSPRVDATTAVDKPVLPVASPSTASSVQSAAKAALASPSAAPKESKAVTKTFESLNAKLNFSPEAAPLVTGFLKAVQSFYSDSSVKIETVMDAYDELAEVVKDEAQLTSIVGTAKGMAAANLCKDKPEYKEAGDKKAYLRDFCKSQAALEEGEECQQLFAFFIDPKNYGVEQPEDVNLQENQVDVPEEQQQADAPKAGYSTAAKVVGGVVLLAGAAYLVTQYAIPYFFPEKAGEELPGTPIPVQPLLEEVVRASVNAATGTTQTVVSQLTENVVPSVAQTVAEQVAPAVVETVVDTVAPAVVETVAQTVAEQVAPAVIETVVDTVAPAVVETVAQTVAEQVAPAVIETVVDTVAPAVVETVVNTVAEQVAPAVIETVVDTVAPTVADSVASFVDCPPVQEAALNFVNNTAATVAETFVPVIEQSTSPFVTLTPTDVAQQGFVTPAVSTGPSVYETVANAFSGAHQTVLAKAPFVGTAEKFVADTAGSVVGFFQANGPVAVNQTVQFAGNVGQTLKGYAGQALSFAQAKLPEAVTVKGYTANISDNLEAAQGFVQGVRDAVVGGVALATGTVATLWGTKKVVNKCRTAAAPAAPKGPAGPAAAPALDGRMSVNDFKQQLKNAGVPNDIVNKQWAAIVMALNNNAPGLLARSQKTIDAARLAEAIQVVKNRFKLV